MGKHLLLLLLLLLLPLFYHHFLKLSSVWCRLWLYEIFRCKPFPQDFALTSAHSLPSLRGKGLGQSLVSVGKSGTAPHPNIANHKRGPGPAVAVTRTILIGRCRYGHIHTHLYIKAVAWVLEGIIIAFEWTRKVRKEKSLPFNQNYVKV